MPKLQLTIEKTYRPWWGIYEAAREVIQNAKDATVEFGDTMDVWHVPGTGGTPDRLIVENVGTVVTRDALLLGRTSKADRKDLIGKFGEGLCVGILAATRAGHAVKVRTGSEVWTPSFERSDTFNADVLTIDIQTGREDKRRTRVEISGISAEEWARFKTCFLFLQERKTDDAIETPSGTLLLAPRLKGRLYVKGIFVQHDANLSYGYDLQDVQTDLDRKLVSTYELHPALRRIWTLALGQRPALADSFVQILDRGKSDVQGIAAWNVGDLPEVAVQAVAKAFVAKHGDALPVATLGESRDLGHLGVKGVVVTEQLSAVLQRVLGSTDQKKAALKTAKAKRHSWHTLTGKEQQALVGALDILGACAPGDATLDNVEVVDFGDAALEGLWSPSEGKIAVARRGLSAPHAEAWVMGVLIHEIAHKRTGAPDGDKAHVQEIETLWTTVYAAALKAMAVRS